MELTRANCTHIQFLQPLLHHRVPMLSPRFSNSFATFNFHKHRFHRLLRTPPLFLNPNIPLSFLVKFVTNAHSLPDDGVAGLAAKVVDIDPFLAVKKKAMDISSELKGTSIFLVGISNTMKTSLGKLLADALRYYYFDSDSLVEEAAGDESAAKSFRERDEEGFRESETEVLKQLSSMGRLVVCAGNGAVQSATNLAFLRHGISIWIDIPLDMVARKAIEDGTQLSTAEIFNSRTYSELTALYEEMRDGYATADATVSLQKVASELGYDDFDAVTTEDMALEVLKEIEKLTRLKKMMEAAARPF